ncbi:hypothetical protein [Micromonospora pallida]|uniref:hypothetical protein n=1 Tax=Micromonospora pallida TaxID=145854 RepID=UPI00114D04AF|nr:hypothetical protein [Micromonospora pallida]
MPGGSLDPGEQRSFEVDYEVLTTTRTYPMAASGGTVEVGVHGSGTGYDRAAYPARFRSTSGSLGNPVPYVQDSQAEASVTSAGAVTLIRQPDGSFTGRLPVTVRWSGDAAHDMLYVNATLPGGVRIWGTDPQDAPSSFTSFEVPGGRLMQDEERTFDVILRAPATTTPGELGSATFSLTTNWNAQPLVDADPTDNTTSFTVTATN